MPGKDRKAFGPTFEPFYAAGGDSNFTHLFGQLHEQPAAGGPEDGGHRDLPAI